MVTSHPVYEHVEEFTLNKTSGFSLIQQRINNREAGRNEYVQIEGQVEVRSSIKVTTAVIILVYSGSTNLITPPYLSINASALVINCPSFAYSSASKPIMSLQARLLMPSGIVLNSLGFSTESLSLVFHSTLNYTANHTHISTGTGNITTFDNSLSTASRKTVIDSGSGSIQGSYSLYDLLSITTSSGSVNIAITPKPASSSAPDRPAQLQIYTGSGSIHAHNLLLSSALPNRTYETDIFTSSGSVDASLVHGRHTSIHTSSGRVAASLSPYGPNTSRSDIDVQTMSGSIDVSLGSSLSNPGTRLSKLYASYRAGSGSLRLSYPPEWEGVVEGGTRTGSMKINWDGLELVRDDHGGWSGRQIKGIKGDGEGVTRFYIGSGSVELRG